MQRPDTPLADTPKPKPVTIGRLKQVVDSLKKERSFNQKMLPSYNGFTESNTLPSSINRRKYNDIESERKFYQDRINKETKSINKYEAIIKNKK